MGGSRNETQGVKEEAGEPMKDFTMKCLLEAFWKILHFLLMVIDLFSHLCGSCEMVVSMVLYYITLVHISCSLTVFSFFLTGTFSSVIIGRGKKYSEVLGSMFYIDCNLCRTVQVIVFGGM